MSYLTKIWFEIWNLNFEHLKLNIDTPQLTISTHRWIRIPKKIKSIELNWRIWYCIFISSMNWLNKKYDNFFFFLVCTLFVGYLGHKHKPRFIAWGGFIMALGAAANAVPKFLIGPYEAGVSQSRDFCR